MYTDQNATSFDDVTGPIMYATVRIKQLGTTAFDNFSVYPPGGSTPGSASYNSARDRWPNTLRRHSYVREFPFGPRWTAGQKNQTARVLYRTRDQDGNANPDCIPPVEGQTSADDCGVGRTVVVSDLTAPNITVLGDAIVTLEAGSHYFEAAAIGVDHVYGDVTDSLSTSVETYSILTETTGYGARRGTCANCYIGLPNCTGAIAGYPDAAANCVTDAAACNACSSPSCIALAACPPHGTDVTAVNSMYPKDMSVRVRYSVRDGSNNVAVGYRTVVVVDTTPPVARIVGDAVVVAEGAEAYSPPRSGTPGVAVTDNLDPPYYFHLGGRITMAVVNGTLGGTVTGSTDFSAIVRDTPFLQFPSFSRFNVSYTAFDSSDNPSLPVFREIVVLDTRGPVFDGTPTQVSQEAAMPWRPDVSATDALDGNFLYLPRFSSRVRSNAVLQTLTCDGRTTFLTQDCPTCPLRCAPVRTCNASMQYETAAPTPTSDRACDALVDCGGQPEVVAPTATSDRTCEDCTLLGGVVGMVGTSGVMVTLPTILEDYVGQCQVTRVQDLYTAAGVPTASGVRLIATTASTGGANPGTLQAKAAGGVGRAAWTPVLNGGSACLFQDGYGADAEAQLRFRPAAEFVGEVDFLFGVCGGNTTGTTTTTFAARLNVLFVNDRPVIDVTPAAPLSTLICDEDASIISTVISILCGPTNGNLSEGCAHYSDAEGAVGGVAITGADTRFGAWAYKCCPQDISITGGCPLATPFTDFPADVSPDRAIGLPWYHCEIRFTPSADFNTFVNNETGAARPASEAPSLSLRGWNGRGYADAAALTSAVALNMTQDTEDMVFALSADATPLYVTVFNSQDSPRIIPPFYSLQYREGSNPMPLADGDAAIVVYNPDQVSATRLTVDVGPADIFQYQIPPGSGIVATREATPTGVFTGRYTFVSPAIATSFYQSLVKSMRYAPVGLGIQGSPNETLRLSFVPQRVTNVEIEVEAFNSRPEVSVGLAATPVNDPQPFQRLSLSDDENTVTRAYMTILDGDGTTMLTFPTSVADIAPVTATLIDMGEGEVQRRYVLGGNETRVAVWQQYVRDITYTGTVYPLRIRLSVSDGLTESIPIVFHVTSGTYSRPRIDLDGTAPGVDTPTSAVKLYQQGLPAVVLLTTPPSLFSFSGFLSRAVVEVVNAYDCPAEIVAANKTLLATLGLESFARSANSLMITGNGSVAAYASALQTVTYRNIAPAFIMQTRIVSFTVYDLVLNGSLPAHTTVGLEELNLSPKVFPDDGLSVVKVVQDVADNDNSGVSLEALLGPVTQRDKVVSTPGYFTQRSCGASGCTYRAAVDKCLATGASLCSVEDIRASFVAGSNTNRYVADRRSLCNGAPFHFALLKSHWEQIEHMEMRTTG